MLTIRLYEEWDWPAIEAIHDEARKQELAFAGLSDAFVPLAQAAVNEDLFGYDILVAELDGAVAGFAACTGDELAWLYVDPAKMRRGIGRALVNYVLEKMNGSCCLEVLSGNTPAIALYKSLGFTSDEIATGHMPGNEKFEVTVHCMSRK